MTKYYMVAYNTRSGQGWFPMEGDGYGPIFGTDPDKPVLEKTARRASLDIKGVDYAVLEVQINHSDERLLSFEMLFQNMDTTVDTDPCADCSGNCAICGDDYNPDPEGLGFVDIEDEDSRIYYFENGEQFQITGATRLAVRPSGNHRVETVDGLKFVVKNTWNVIEIDADKWTV